MTYKIKDAYELGLLIREKRLAAGLDQGQLADKIGVNRRWVNEIEKGKPRAAVGLVLKALNSLGVTFKIDDATDALDPENKIDNVDINAIIDDHTGKT